MNNFEEDYKKLLTRVMTFGTEETNRTGTNTLVLPNQLLTFKYDPVRRQIPLLTGKMVFYKKAKAEFEWIKRGYTNVQFLNDNGIYWWDEFADEDGELGKTYGYQLRNFNGNFDQLTFALNQIEKGSRRAYMSFWNPSELDETALPCCYTGMKFTLTDNGRTLNAALFFRSSDLFLGLPYDLLFGYFMLAYVADITSKRIGEISYLLSDAHIYTNHEEAVWQYLNTTHYQLPSEIEAELGNYKSGPHIPAKLNN